MKSFTEAKRSHKNYLPLKKWEKKKQSSLPKHALMIFCSLTYWKKFASQNSVDSALIAPRGPEQSDQDLQCMLFARNILIKCHICDRSDKSDQ